MIRTIFLAILLFIFGVVAQPLIDFTNVDLRGDKEDYEVKRLQFDMFIIDMSQNWRCSTDLIDSPLKVCAE